MVLYSSHQGGFLVGAFVIQQLPPLQDVGSVIAGLAWMYVLRTGGYPDH